MTLKKTVLYALVAVVIVVIIGAPDLQAQSEAQSLRTALTEATSEVQRALTQSSLFQALTQELQALGIPQIAALAHFHGITPWACGYINDLITHFEVGQDRLEDAEDQLWDALRRVRDLQRERGIGWQFVLSVEVVAIATHFYNVARATRAQNTEYLRWLRELQADLCD